MIANVFCIIPMIIGLLSLGTMQGNGSQQIPGCSLLCGARVCMLESLLHYSADYSVSAPGNLINKQRRNATATTKTT
jgi:hypothetical protein